MFSCRHNVPTAADLHGSVVPWGPRRLSSELKQVDYSRALAPWCKALTVVLDQNIEEPFIALVLHHTLTQVAPNG